MKVCEFDLARVGDTYTSKLDKNTYIATKVKINDCKGCAFKFIGDKTAFTHCLAAPNGCCEYCYIWIKDENYNS